MRLCPYPSRRVVYPEIPESGRRPLKHSEKRGALRCRRFGNRSQPTMTEIRTAGKNDIEAIAALYQEQFEVMAELQPCFFQKGGKAGRSLKASSRRRIRISCCASRREGTGLCSPARKKVPFFVPYRYACLMDIAASAGERGKGFGCALMEVAKCRAAGSSNI